MRFIFVTQELAPFVPGGAATVVDELATALAREHEVVVILASPTRPGAGAHYEIEHVAVPEPDGSLSWFVDRSRRVADALAAVVKQRGRPDLIEFTDFEALGFWAFSHRPALGLEAVPMGVRLHGPVGAISDAMGAAPPPWEALDTMERSVFAMADEILAPSAAMAAWVISRYSADPDRVVVAPPIVPAVTPRTWTPSTHPAFFAFGRLTEQKGVDNLVRAMLPLFADDSGVRLVFVGADGWSAVEQRPMSEVLRSLAPEQFRSRIEMLGPMDREPALDLLSTAWAVIVPSRFETFCLAAHEVRRAGFPVVATDLPAFEPYGPSEGLLLYDGSLTGLTDTLRTLTHDRALLSRLAAAPPPPVGDPMAAYLGALPEPRHPYAQAARATAAVHQLEPLLAPPPRRGAMRARRLLELLPRRWGSLAVRVMPRRVKDWFRGLASWPAEVERRARAARRLHVEERIRGGQYPVQDRPRVAVVVPCFNHGEFVMEALLSVFEQTMDSWEVIVVDDGSTDPATVAVLGGIDWPRVRVIRQENTGLPGARNRGIAEARGEFVVPLDADDELLPLYLDRMTEALEAEPGAGYAHCWAEWFGDVNRVWATRPFNPYTIRISNSVLQVATIRRSALDRVGGYDPSLTSGNEDWDLWMRMLEAGFGNVQVREVLYRYRKHGASMSVETEANFEAGLRALVARHPGLYDPSALRLAKRMHYPAVTIVAPVRPSGVAMDADIEVLEGDDICAGVRVARGKYLTVVSEGSAVDGAALAALVDRLESSPAEPAAEAPGLTLMRRWALVDPSAPFERQAALPLCPDAGWEVPRRMVVGGRSLEVERQRPEEAAYIPEWLLP